MTNFNNINSVLNAVAFIKTLPKVFSATEYNKAREKVYVDKPERRGWETMRNDNGMATVNHLVECGVLKIDHTEEVKCGPTVTYVVDNNGKIIGPKGQVSDSVYDYLRDMGIKMREVEELTRTTKILYLTLNPNWKQAYKTYAACKQNAIGLNDYADKVRKLQREQELRTMIMNELM